MANDASVEGETADAGSGAGESSGDVEVGSQGPAENAGGEATSDAEPEGQPSPSESAPAQGGTAEGTQEPPNAGGEASAGDTQSTDETAETAHSEPLSGGAEVGSQGPAENAGRGGANGGGDQEDQQQEAAGDQQSEQADRPEPKRDGASEAPGAEALDSEQAQTDNATAEQTSNEPAEGGIQQEDADDERGAQEQEAAVEGADERSTEAEQADSASPERSQEQTQEQTPEAGRGHESESNNESLESASEQAEYEQDIGSQTDGEDSQDVGRVDEGSENAQVPEDGPTGDIKQPIEAAPENQPAEGRTDQAIESQRKPSLEQPVQSQQPRSDSVDQPSLSADNSRQPTQGGISEHTGSQPATIETAQVDQDSRPAPQDSSDSDNPTRDDEADTAVEKADAIRLHTAAGSAYYAPNDTGFRQSAESVRPADGQYTVDIHGNQYETAFQSDASDGRSWESLSPQQLGQVIRNDQNWNGEPIRLLSCNTGEELPGGGPPYAQQLADELEVGVESPTSKVGVNPSTGEPVLEPGGTWVTFYPR